MSNPFLTGLSGLYAAKREIGVISNNIANAETKGFKSSGVRFGDIYTGYQGASGFKTDTGTKAIGGGVSVQDVVQKFDQGSIDQTDRELDVAINGQGFLQFIDNNGSPQLSRIGSLDIDENGFLVNSLGYRVSAFQTNKAGELTSDIGDIQFSRKQISPKPTSEITLGANLDSNSEIKDPLLFDKTNPNTYNFSTSVTTYDSLGKEHLLTSYYIKNNTNEWNVSFTMDGDDLSPNGKGAGESVIMKFDSLGAVVDVDGDTSGQVSFDPYTYSDGAEDFVASMDMSQFTQFSNASVITNSKQNGNNTGDISGISIDKDGLISTNFNNGTKVAMGKLVLVNVNNPNGLKQEGNGMYTLTNASGSPLYGTPGDGDFGEIESGNLEGSNVEMAKELVGLISSQRFYQANSKTISTWDQLLQETIRLGGG